MLCTMPDISGRKVHTMALSPPGPPGMSMRAMARQCTARQPDKAGLHLPAPGLDLHSAAHRTTARARAGVMHRKLVAACIAAFVLSVAAACSSDGDPKSWSSATTTSKAGADSGRVTDLKLDPAHQFGNK